MRRKRQNVSIASDRSQCSSGDRPRGNRGRRECLDIPSKSPITPKINDSHTQNRRDPRSDAAWCGSRYPDKADPTNAMWELSTVHLSHSLLDEYRILGMLLSSSQFTCNPAFYCCDLPLYFCSLAVQHCTMTSRHMTKFERRIALLKTKWNIVEQHKVTITLINHRLSYSR
jgi:hypothetical protein